MKIIGFAGQAGVGKDTIASIVLDHVSGHSAAFADPMRHAAMAMFGLTMHQMMDRELKEQVIERWGKSPRELLQLLGTEAGRDVFGDDIWCKRAQLTLDQIIASDRLEPLSRDVCVFTDVRFLDEMEWIQRLGGVVINVGRVGVMPVGITGHRSAQYLPSERADFTFLNFGDLDDLEKVVPAALACWLDAATPVHVAKQDLAA